MHTCILLNIKVPKYNIYLLVAWGMLLMLLVQQLQPPTPLVNAATPLIVQIQLQLPDFVIFLHAFEGKESKPTTEIKNEEIS